MFKLSWLIFQLIMQVVASFEQTFITYTQVISKNSVEKIFKGLANKTTILNFSIIKVLPEMPVGGVSL